MSKTRGITRPATFHRPASRAAMLGLIALVLQAGAMARPDPGEAAPAGDPNVSRPELPEGGRLRPSPGWPVWIKDFHRGARTEKTSAIAYAGRDAGGRRCFFLADESGQLHFCRVSQDGDSGAVDLRLETVGIDPSMFTDVPLERAWDFEALDLDPIARVDPEPQGHARDRWCVPDSIDGILSIEGRGPNAGDDTRVLAVRLCAAPKSSHEGSGWRIASRGDAIPGARFWQGQVSSDRGFEGVAISRGYYWLGLESLDERGDLHTRGSVLYIFDRTTGKVGTLPTRDLGIHSICGLAAVSDTVTVVADRNRQSLFVLIWDSGAPGILRAGFRFPLDLPAPGGLRYAIPTIEGVTVDERGDFWCVVDPWRGHYRPVGAAPESLYVYLAAEIPMMYRFPGRDVWRVAGLDGLWPDASDEAAAESEPAVAPGTDSPQP